MIQEVILFASLLIFGNPTMTMAQNDAAGFKECRGKPSDIAFIIDASRSIYPRDFYDGTKFLQRFVEHFEISPDMVRIAAVTFGKKVIPDAPFGFDQHTTKSEVLQALKSIKFKPNLGGSTNTAAAIAYAHKQFFTNARPNVNKIAIVLTDGQSDNFTKTKTEAALLKSQGVLMIAIGVGNKVKVRELHAIASDEKYVFQVISYVELKNIMTTLGVITCKTGMPTTTPKQNIPTTTIAPTKAPVFRECRSKPSDIAFIIDASRSIYPPDFYDGTKFLQRFVEHFEISPDMVRIAAVTFGKKVIPDAPFGFDQHTTKSAVLQALKSIKFKPNLGGSTNTAAAIAYAHKQFFTNARPNVNKIAIVLTDGQSDDFTKTKTEAALLKSQGVQMIAIGVGNRVKVRELRAIASDEKHVFQVISYVELKNIMTTLGVITCKTILADN